VRLTENGRRLELDVRAQARRAEEKVAAMLGEPRFTQLRDALRELVAQLDAARARANTSPP
jgi:hypothetical protein